MRLDRSITINNGFKTRIHYASIPSGMFKNANVYGLYTSLASVKFTVKDGMGLL